MISPFRTGKRCIWIRISDRQIHHLGSLSCWSATRWGGCRVGQRCNLLWSRLTTSVRLRCPCSYVCPPSQQILSGAIWAGRTAAPVCFDEALPGVFLSQPTPRYAKETQHPASALLAHRAVDYEWFMPFLQCAVQKAIFGHFVHIQRQAHDWLFTVYTTYLPCYTSRHVKNLQDISCCF